MGQSQIFIKRFKVIVIPALVLLAGVTSHASTSDWGSSQPRWAAVEEGSTSRNQEKSNQYNASSAKRSNVSPFSPSSHNLSMELGQVFLMGDTGNQYANNLGLQVHYTYGVSEIFAFDASVGLSKHEAKDSNGLSDDKSLSMLMATAGLRTNLAWYDRIVPYINFGLGFYRPSYRLDAENSVSPVLFGIHVGPGIDLQLTRSLFFGTGLTFHDIFGARKNTINGPMNVGGTFTSFSLHAGVTF